MTTNKRFKNVEEKLDWGTVQYFTYYDEKITDKEIEKLVNHLLNQNEQLKSKNRGLQSELQIFKEDATHSNLQINKLADENDKLKSRVEYLEQKIDRERTSYQKQHEKWEEEIQKENEQLKAELDFWKKQAKQCPMRSCKND